jgi:hypothetical protein
MMRLFTVLFKQAFKMLTFLNEEAKTDRREIFMASLCPLQGSFKPPGIPFTLLTYTTIFVKTKLKTGEKHSSKSAPKNMNLVKKHTRSGFGSGSL